MRFRLDRPAHIEMLCFIFMGVLSREDGPEGRKQSTEKTDSHVAYRSESMSFAMQIQNHSLGTI